MTNVFISPKIKVGFQKRDDTFTGQLAYIIYYDEKGKLRKQKSWDSWRDKKITSQEFDNTPMDGFTLNKDVKRYSGGWFSSNRTMIRVHDPRGFEFEVTTENLIGILMHTDCLRRGLVGQFVYAWVGAELVLLPVNSEEYTAATKYTVGLAKKVKAKDLIPGASYKTKREGDVTYMGKFDWYEYPLSGGKYSHRIGLRTATKCLVFTNDNGKTFFRKSSVDFLSEANGESAVPNYSTLMDKFNNETYANKVVKFEFKQVSFDPSTSEQPHYNRKQLFRSNYTIERTFPQIMFDFNVRLNYQYNASLSTKDQVEIAGYITSGPDEYSKSSGINKDTGEVCIFDFHPDSNTRGFGYYNRHSPIPLNLDQMNSLKLYDFYIIFENGTSKKMDSIYKFINEGT